MEELNAADIHLLLSQVEFGVVNDENQEPNERFAKVTSEDVDRFLQTEENQNTRRKTEQDLKVFTEFLRSNLEFRVVADIHLSNLATYLSMFILSVKKKDCTEYEPSSLRSYISSVQRVLKRKGYEKHINDSEFSKMKETLDLKQKSLKKDGKDNKPKAAVEISNANIDEMYTAGKLGKENPHALLHSMWLMCTMHFGMRTGRECYNLRWVDITLLTDDDGGEFLLYDTERQTKTRTGADARNIRSTKPRAYATPDFPDRDPVSLYKLYRDHRPDSTLSDESPFFLAINYNRKSNGLCVRKHLVQKLSDEGLPANQIMQITGHKNVNSINEYCHLNANQSKGISHILSNVPSTEGEEVRSAGAVCRRPSAAVSRPPSTGDLGLPASQVNTYNKMDHQNFLTSLISGNNFYGTVNINFTPDTMSLNRQSNVTVSKSPRGEKRALEA